MSNLSQFQQKLINELTNEFKRLNPETKSNNGVKRFSIDTIDHCINEEEKFKQTIAKHNLTMVKVFVNQFKEELKSLKKEFGKVLDVQIGIPNSTYSFKYTLEEVEDRAKKQPLNIRTSDEFKLFLVSKTKVFDRGDSRWNYCNNKKYTEIFVHFKISTEKVILESGKEVILYKVVGLNYSNYDYLNSGSYKSDSSTLDGLIQSTKSIQQAIVSLVK
jgi:hypothetical protein